MSTHSDALRFISGQTGDSPSYWLSLYRQKGGGYEGLQAVAEAALAADPDQSATARHGGREFTVTIVDHPDHPDHILVTLVADKPPRGLANLLHSFTMTKLKDEA